MNEETNSQGTAGEQPAAGEQPVVDAGAQPQPTADAQSAPAVQPAAGTVQIAADQGTVQMPAVQGGAQSAAQPIESQPTAVPVSAQPAGTVQVAPIQGTAQPIGGQAAASAQPATGTPTATPYTPGAPTATPYTPGGAQPADAGQAATTTATAYQAAGTAPAVGGPVTGAPQPSPTPALVCGILAIVMCFVPFIGIISGIGLGVAAIILATRYFRSGGTQGTAKAGRICGIVGLVIAGILIILNIIAVVGAFMTIGTYGSMMNNLAETPAISSSSSASSSSSSSYSELTESQEEEATETASAALQKIKDQDPKTMQQIADMLEDSFDEAASWSAYDITMKNLGLDPMVVAQKLTAGFEYEPFYTGTGYEGDASASFDVTYRNLYDVMNDFEALIDDLDTSTIATDEEAYKKMGELLLQAIDEVELDDSGFFIVELDDENGTWTIIEDEWEDELESYFSFY